MRMIQKLAVVVGISICVGNLAVTTARAEIINGIACKVGRDIITVNEFNTTYEQVRARAYMFGMPVPSRQEVMDGFIDNLLIKREAERRGLVVSESELDEIINNIKEQGNISDEEFQVQLREEGLTEEELRDQYRSEIVRTRLVNFFISGSDYGISEEELKDFYEDPANRRFFATLGTVTLAQIYIPVPNDLSYQDALEFKERVNMISEETQSGKSFEELVMQYSAAANKERNRGNLGSFTEEQLLSFMNPQDVNLIFSLEKGGVTPPIRMQDGYYIFRINDIVEAKQLTYEESQERIQSFLLKLKGEERMEAWLDEKRAATRIEIVMEME
jgi:parvulin-like peptidyl-prolyl isomerase